METFSTLLAICAGNSPVPGEFPAQRPVTWSFDVFFDLRLNKRSSKQSWDWWFEMPSRPLWRHCNMTFTLVSDAVAPSQRPQFLTSLCGQCSEHQRESIVRLVTPINPLLAELSSFITRGIKTSADGTEIGSLVTPWCYEIFRFWSKYYGVQWSSILCNQRILNRVRFLPLARIKLRLNSVNHKPG